MQVGDRGLHLIAEYEGFAGHLYDDPSGNATIGYGFLVHLHPYHRQVGACPYPPGDNNCDTWREGITADAALRLLRTKAQYYADAMDNLTGPELNQNQYDALTSLTYNIGPGGYLNSAVRTAVNRQDWGAVCPALNQIIRGSDGVVYGGLVRRRAAECALFNEPVEPAEEDEMKPFLCWNVDQKAVYFIGPGGARWITDANVVKELEGVFGPVKVALSQAAIEAIGLAH